MIPYVHMPIERSCGFVIAYRGGLTDLFLLVRQHTHWSLPKGHIEKGESALETARRELLEETGISDIRVVPGYEFVERYTFERDGIPTQKVNTYFLALVSTTEGVRPQEGEILECRFVSFEKALELLSFEDSKSTLADASRALDGISLK